MNGCRRVRWPNRIMLRQVKHIYLTSFDLEDRVPFYLLIIGILIGKLKLIVVGQRKVHGFALWAALPAPAREVAYLGYLAVDKEQRNLGAGGLLFQLVASEAAALGYHTLVWEVEVPEGDSDNPRQHRVAFYQRQGGRIASCASRYTEITATGQTKPMRIMWRSLTAALRVEERADVVRWIQGIYRLAYRSRYTAAEIQRLFMEPAPIIE
ncbi:MAG: GNAT family N-acetyltransferase [Anaerolineae bacterium]